MRILSGRIQEQSFTAHGHNALFQWEERRCLLLTLTDEGGLSAQGEAAPLPGYSPETLADCRRALAALRWPVEIADSVDAIAQWSRSIAPGAARCAVETALLELLAIRTGTTLPRLLGAAPDASVAVSALLPERASGRWQEAAAHAVARGIRVVKVKAGVTGQWHHELSELRALRDHFGGLVQLRIDLNGTLPPDDLEQRLAELAPLHPECVEEPGDGWWRLTTSPVTLAADESLTRHTDDVVAAVKRGLCRTVTLKPMLHGLLRAHQWAGYFASHGADLIVTHMFDGPIGRRVALALALAHAPAMRACGLDTQTADGPASLDWSQAST